MKSSGYSKTPLARKLGIKEGFKAVFVNQPTHYFTLFEQLPSITEVKNPEEGSIDFIHLFCKSSQEFERQSIELKKLLKKSGMLWVSWPKGSSGIETDLSRDPIRNYLLSKGLVDVKVCAIDEHWSGLKFVYRLKDRK